MSHLTVTLAAVSSEMVVYPSPVSQVEREAVVRRVAKVLGRRREE